MAKPKPLRVTRIRARYILGLTEVDLSPGAVTIARGDNSVGKTSLMRLVEVACRGGKAFPAPVSLKSEDGSGEVQIEIDPDIELTRRFGLTRKGEPKEDLSVTRGGDELREPQKFINGLLGNLMWSPVRWAQASPRERRTLLLEALNLRTSRAALQALLPAETVLPDDVDYTGPALDVVESLRSRFYARRHAEGQRKLQLAKTVAELSGDIPQDYRPADPAERRALMSQMQGLQAQAGNRDRLAAALARTERELAQAQASDQAHAARILALQAEIAAAPAVDAAPLKAQIAETEKEIARLTTILAGLRPRLAQVESQNSRRQRAEAELAVVQSAQLSGAGALETAQEWAIKRKADLDAAPEVGAELERIRGRLGELDAATETDAICARRDATQRELNGVTDTWASLEAIVVALSTTVPKALVAGNSLGIEGLEIGEDVTLRGVPVEQLSGKERMLLSVQIAGALAGPLKVLNVDAAESLGPDCFKALAEWIRENEFQAFITRVTEGPLAVETDGKEVKSVK